MLNIEKRQNDNLIILDLEGDVIMGGGSAKLRETISDLIDNENGNILLNFQKVRYIDSSGTGEILSTFRKITENGGKLKLSNLSPKVEEVLTLSSILPILDVYEDEEGAING
ncbi:MAG: STAS domain-containing protein [Pyrinomonadaceae bacterium]|jgi:anti-sigma B factor antagonist|nr:STAS domain-containing protein [Pyrinomonadaceae bacterium]